MHSGAKGECSSWHCAEGMTSFVWGFYDVFDAHHAVYMTMFEKNVAESWECGKLAQYYFFHFREVEDRTGVGATPGVQPCRAKESMSGARLELENR